MVDTSRTIACCWDDIGGAVSTNEGVTVQLQLGLGFHVQKTKDRQSRKSVCTCQVVAGHQVCNARHCQISINEV